ncbi:MAG: hypothetical protein K2X03_06455 [Bryobacteraceae bacterium]|nr:hypothetical protein [Bryobacteraceae bacterium]
MGKATLLLLLGFAVWGQVPAGVSAQGLAQEVMRNKRAQDRDLTEYTHEFDYRFRYFDRQGKLQQQIHDQGEGYQSSSRNIPVHLFWNDAPVPAAKVEQKRREAAKELQKDHEQRLKQGPAAGEGHEYGSDLFGLRMEFYHVLRRCPLENLRRETVDGRETFVFDYLPAPAPVKEMPQITQMRGTFWIDAQDRMLRRWTAHVAKGPSQGHRFWQEDFERVLQRIWAVTRIELNLNVPLPGWKVSRRVEMESRYSAYKHFGVEVEQKIAEPKP